MSKHEDKIKSSVNAVNNKLTNTKGKKLDSLIKSQKMANYRILQKNLVYVIGLSEKLANKDLLSKYEYFGQYGQILKIVVNKNKAYYSETQTKPSYSAYISYTSPHEAALAILAIDSIIADDHLMRASFGTTKYCTFYLKSSECTNKDCLYLHSVTDDEVIVNKDELTSNISYTVNSNNLTNKNVFYEQHLLAIKITNLYDKDTRTVLANQSKKKSVLPSMETIYNKEIVIENDPEFIKKYKTKNGNKYQLKINPSTSNQNNSDQCVIIESKIDILNSININNDCNTLISDISNFTKDSPEGNGTPPLQQRQSLYRNRDKSRFPFVNNGDSQFNDKYISSVIPDYVFDVINKKASRFTFFKKLESQFELEKDKLYYEKCRGKDDSWMDFISTNMNLENN